MDLPEYAGEVKKAFDQVFQEMRNMSVMLLRLRYLTGEIRPIDLANLIKVVYSWENKTPTDLDLVEMVENFNKERDAFYKRVVDGARDAESA